MAHLLLCIIYISFISLGLPDAVLGSAWPTITTEFNIPVSYMGILTILIAGGTIISSLHSDRMTKKIGVHAVSTISIALTAIALFGFSVSNNIISLCLWAIPYGLGAGSIDSALNNYVALHYKSRHMSWLHCMWGVGATLGPYIMGATLLGGFNWHSGYSILFVIQIVLATIVLLSSKLWDKKADSDVVSENKPPLRLKDVLSIKGVVPMIIAFFCFCSLESTAGQWASSYLVTAKGLNADIAASFGSLFYLGITVGRGINGFLAIKFSDKQLIYAGSSIMLVGLLVLFLPLGSFGALVGIAIVGLGSAPVFPCIIHSAPGNFGVQNSHAIIGVLMAGAYAGCLLMPTLFGLIARFITIGLYPVYLSILLVVMIVMFTRATQKQT